MAPVNDYFNPFFISAENNFLSTSDARMEETRATLEPQRRLLLAILEDAIYCFLRFEPGAGHKELALFTEAEEWIFRKEEYRIFSFQCVCEALQIDPDYLRKGLRHRQRGKLRNRSHVKNYRSLLNIADTAG